MLLGGRLRPLLLRHKLREPLCQTLPQTERKLAARRHLERSSLLAAVVDDVMAEAAHPLAAEAEVEVEAAYQLAAESPETESSQEEVVEDRASEAQAAVEVDSAFAACHVAEEAEVVEDRASEADAAADHADARTQAAAV